MRRPLLSILFVFTFCLSAFVSAESTRKFTLDNTQLVQINSAQTGQTHELIIALPSSYHSSPERRYPVLYALDGYWDIPMLTATYGNLIYDNLVPEFIIVGFSYPGAVDYGKERRRDFTPTKGAYAEGSAGGAAKFLQFIKETVAPKIEAEYRGDKNQRALTGTSLGGLFTLYAMYEDPEFFDRYLAISPAAIWDNGYLARRDADYAKKNQTLKARAFISYGTDEYKPFADAIIEYQKIIKKRSYKDLALMNYRMEGLRHTGVKGDGFAQGLMFVWKDIAPTGPSGLERDMRGIPAQ